MGLLMSECSYSEEVRLKLDFEFELVLASEISSANEINDLIVATATKRIRSKMV